jgi:hypothetical protein
MTNFIQVPSVEDLALTSDWTLYRAAILIPGSCFMPPANLLFSKPPAEIDYSAVTKMGKVTEAEIYVLYQYAKILNRLEIHANLLKA